MWLAFGQEGALVERGEGQDDRRGRAVDGSEDVSAQDGPVARWNADVAFADQGHFLVRIGCRRRGVWFGHANSFARDA
jgi:hypothetical protein